MAAWHQRQHNGERLRAFKLRVSIKQAVMEKDESVARGLSMFPRLWAIS